MPSKKSSRGNPKPKARPGAAVNKTTGSSEAATTKPKTVPASIPPKERQPTQQQLERMARARRKQQQRNFGTVVAVLVIVGLIGGFIYFITRPPASSTANNPKATVSAIPTAPQVPPPVTGTPVTLPDGLQYIDISVPQEGTSTPATTVTPGATTTTTVTPGTTTTPAPTATPIPIAKNGDMVQVYYTGWLQANDVEFDSSYDHSPLQPLPVTLGSGGTIKGFEEGIVGMKVGGKRRLIIPPALGYGDQAQGPIPANSTLIFDIELVSVQSGS
ncbi:MAG TPA: FKBP-type peptidyl-prolyl cis-trans isomerase [Ktedonobacterales bacterium]